MMNKAHVFVAVAAIVLMVGCSKTPDSQQIKIDLIGQTLRSTKVPEFGPLGMWRFESLSQFQELTINNKNRQGDLIEYDVSMLLKDMDSGKQYRAESTIVYKKMAGAWKIVSISKKEITQVR